MSTVGTMRRYTRVGGRERDSKRKKRFQNLVEKTFSTREDFSHPRFLPQQMYVYTYICIQTCISPLSPSGGGLGGSLGAPLQDSVEQHSNTSTAYTASLCIWRAVSNTPQSLRFLLSLEYTCVNNKVKSYVVPRLLCGSESHPGQLFFS